MYLFYVLEYYEPKHVCGGFLAPGCFTALIFDIWIFLPVQKGRKRTTVSRRQWEASGGAKIKNQVNLFSITDRFLSKRETVSWSGISSLKPEFRTPILKSLSIGILSFLSSQTVFHVCVCEQDGRQKEHPRFHLGIVLQS